MITLTRSDIQPSRMLRFVHNAGPVSAAECLCAQKTLRRAFRPHGRQLNFTHYRSISIDIGRLFRRLGTFVTSPCNHHGNKLTRVAGLNAGRKQNRQPHKRTRPTTSKQEKNRIERKTTMSCQQNMVLRARVCVCVWTFGDLVWWCYKFSTWLVPA